MTADAKSLEDLGNLTGQSAEAAAPLHVQKLDAQGRAYATGKRKNAIARVWVSRGHGKIINLFVPYECESCEFEEEVLGDVGQYVAVAQGGEAPKRKCPKCAGTMNVLTDSFFVFLSR